MHSTNFRSPKYLKKENKNLPRKITSKMGTSRRMLPKHQWMTKASFSSKLGVVLVSSLFL